MKTFTTTLFCIAFALSASAQESEKDSIFTLFEDCPPLRQMKCGLWINAIGDIALKDGALLGKTFQDYYMTTIYDKLDTINNYTVEWKNVVDTASFKSVNRYCYVDKNYLYMVHPDFTPYPYINHGIDLQSMKVFEEYPDFVCDKRNCFVRGERIEGADPKTFRPIFSGCQDYYFSRDKNAIYSFEDKLSDEKIRQYEEELEITLDIPPPPPLKSRTEKCYHNGKLKETERRAIYPFNKASQVKVISFPMSYDRELPIENKRIVPSLVYEVITLSDTQINKLTDILYNYNYSPKLYWVTRMSSVCGCLHPRHAIVFTDSLESVEAYMQVDFIETRIVTDPPEEVNTGVFCDGKYELLKSFFSSVGIKHFNDEVREEEIELIELIERKR
jgi:hypothetical protein